MVVYCCRSGSPRNRPETKDLDANVLCKCFVKEKPVREWVKHNKKGKKAK